MLPSRPKVGGPFARSVREALESVLAVDAAEELFAAALQRGGLTAVPEEIVAFRNFCEGPLRTAVMRGLGPSAIEQVFERIGHVLWMASSDLSALDAARTWSRSDPWEDDSGVRHVDSVRPPIATPAEGLTTEDIPPVSSERSPNGPTTLGRMRAQSGTPARGRVTQEIPARVADQRRGSSPPPAVDASIAPTAVLAISLDDALVADLRARLKDHCPVRQIEAPTEIAGALVTSGLRPAIFYDATLPSIDLTTLTGLAPILPPGIVVVLWGVTQAQHARLAAKFPILAAWAPSDTATDPGRFVLEQHRR